MISAFMGKYGMYAKSVFLLCNILQGFPPPPVYTQRPTMRLNQMASTTSNTNTTTNSNPQTSPALRVPFQQLQRETTLLQQQQQKERLLQQQQKQSLVVPVNATANADQMCK